MHSNTTLCRLTDICSTLSRKLFEAIGQDCDYKLIKQLDAQLSSALDILKNTHFSSREEISGQIKFFLQRAQECPDFSAYEAETLNQLVDRYSNFLCVIDDSSSWQIQPDQSCKEGFSIFDSAEQKIISCDEKRMSLFDLDYRYVSTTTANADFNNMLPEQLNGKHLAEVIGGKRFERRAQNYYDRCFSGVEQKYNYFLDTRHLGRRLMSCDLKPFKDSDGSVRGLFFMIDDITDHVDNLARSGATNAVN